MRLAALLALLAYNSALADPFPKDRPLSVDVRSGLITSVDDPVWYEQHEIDGGRYFNSLGVKRLDAWIEQVQVDKAMLTAENETLKRRVDEVAAQPGLSVGAALTLTGIGLLVGVLGSIFVVGQLR